MDQAMEPDASTGSPNGSERSNGAGGNDNGQAAAAKRKGKGTKESEEAHKEGYIHVRARKGQATNNHSLAERVKETSRILFLPQRLQTSVFLLIFRF